MKQNFDTISIIDKIIYLSKVIIALKVLKLHMAVELGLASRTRVRLHTMEYVSSQLDEIDSKLSKIYEYLETLLKPYFKGKEFGYCRKESWGLTAKDMQKGYLTLNETDKNGNYLGNDQNIEFKYVLFLQKYTDKGFKIEQGDLLPFGEVTSILGNQLSLFIGEVDIVEYSKAILSITTKKINLKS